MRILISNDDGYLASGIEVLAKAVAPFASEVLVVAPERDRSGASSSLTLDRPLSVRTALNGFYYVNGTPTDCVHLALTGIFADNPPDLILSGINRGANMGDDTIYSGTVAAAIEGHLFGIPAVAFSLCSPSRKNLTCAGEVATRFIKNILENKPTGNYLFNVNIPDCSFDEISEWKITRLGKRHKAKGVVPTKSPNGETLYWIGAAGAACDIGADTDFYAINNNCVAVTPLMVDLTNYDKLSDYNNWLSPKKLK